MANRGRTDGKKPYVKLDKSTYNAKKHHDDMYKEFGRKFKKNNLNNNKKLGKF